MLTALHFTQHGLRPTAYDSVEHGAWSMEHGVEIKRAQKHKISFL